MEKKVKIISSSKFVTLCILLGIFAYCNLQSQSKKNSVTYKITDNNVISNTENNIIANEALSGWLQINTTQNAVIMHLGKPSRKGKDEYWDATGTFVQKWYYISKGIIIEMESEKIGGFKKVYSTTITAPSKYKTNKMIGIGSHKETVLKAYNNNVDKLQSDSLSIVIGNIYEGITFTLYHGIVNKIFIGSGAE